ncbi:MAG: glycosyltransferase [Akkermansia sp.]|nr:glycosyltransferase [Akkermansia sp.]
MKTILFLLARYPAFGGIETVTTVLANSLAEQYRIVLCSVKGEKEHELLHRLDARITFRMLPNAGKKERIAALETILTEYRVELVIYQDSYAPNQYLAHYIKQRGGIKLIVAEHSSPSLSRKWVLQLPQIPWWNLYRRFKLIYFNGKGHLLTLIRRTRLYTICDRYVVLSEGLKQEFLDNSFVHDTAKLCAIGNPVSYTPLPVNLNDKKKQVLFIGQFVGLKGINRLLRIWAKVQEQATEWSLVLVGDGPLMPSVREQIQEGRLQRVCTEGFRSNVRDYCAAASVFCLCSLFEGFPMVLPEAMCSGAVPIGFNSFAALEDIITDGVSGYSVPAFDEDAFAARLLQLMQDDALRLRMAEAALARSAAFNVPAVAARWQTLLDDVLGNA